MNTPYLPGKPGALLAALLPPQPQSDFGVGAGAEVFGAGAPPRRPSTSPTISRIKASLTALIFFWSHRLNTDEARKGSPPICVQPVFHPWLGVPGIKNFLTQHIHRIDDADDDGVHGGVFHAAGETGTAALAEHHQFVDARAHGVHGHDG